MPQIRFDVSNSEFASLQQLMNEMGATSIPSAVKKLALEAAGCPQPITAIVSDVLKEIDELSAGDEFTTGDMIRRLSTDQRLAFSFKNGAAVPSTVSAQVGKILSSQQTMNAHNFTIARVSSRTNIFVKLAAGPARIEPEDEAAE